MTAVASGVQLTFSNGNSGQQSSYQVPFNYNRPGYRFKAANVVRVEDVMVGEGPGRRLRKNVANVRRHVDYVPCVLNHLQARIYQLGRQNRIAAQPDELYANTALPPASTPDKPMDCVLTKFVRAAMNKVKCPVYTLAWTPEGKRLITGASSGEFTLWNGTAFNFETILQAHDVAVRSMNWAHNGNWLISGDADGFIKYWQPNMNNVHMFHAHKDDAIRGLKFAPTDKKFVSGSDDGTARVWDFARYTEEFNLRGHGSEIRCLDWHPSTSLICTGSRDTQQPIKMWDAASGKCVITLQHHKSSVMAVEFNQNGNWLLTASRDQLIKLYDIRTMKVLKNYRGHKKEVTSLAWHPIHEGLFVTGGGDGSIAYWLVDNHKEVALLEHAHDQAIWCVKWHPLGHILATGSNDNNTKFWARNRPGDTHEDIFGLASFTSNMMGTADYKEQKQMFKEMQERKEFIPGMGLDEEVFESMNRDITVGGVNLQLPDDPNAKMQGQNFGAKRTLIKQPPPKRAQRQFERMWNVSKPGANEDDGGEDVGADAFKKEKASLLGPPPASLLGGGPQSQGAKPSMLGAGPSMRWNPQTGPPPGGPSRTTLLKAPNQMSNMPPPRPPPTSGAPPPLAGSHMPPPQSSTHSSQQAPPAGGRAPFPPGMWPPGIPMPANIKAMHTMPPPPHQQHHQPPEKDIIIKEEVDVDYRQADEDLRAPPASTQNMPPPAMPRPQFQGPPPSFNAAPPRGAPNQENRGGHQAPPPAGEQWRTQRPNSYKPQGQGQSWYGNKGPSGPPPTTSAQDTHGHYNTGGDHDLRQGLPQPQVTSSGEQPSTSGPPPSWSSRPPQSGVNYGMPPPTNYGNPPPAGPPPKQQQHSYQPQHDGHAEPQQRPNQTQGGSYRGGYQSTRGRGDHQSGGPMRGGGGARGRGRGYTRPY